jgi:hypothetical protein
MCTADFATAEVDPLWQVSQVPVPTALATGWTNLALAQLVVDEWQPSHDVTPLWVVVFGLDVNP